MEPIPPLPSPRTPGLAIAGLVLGILGLLCFGPFAALPAVVCAHRARSRIKRSEGALQGEGIALAGLIMGYIGIGICVLLIPFYAAIGLPAYLSAQATARRVECQVQLSQIDIAKESWAVEFSARPGSDVPLSQLEPFLPRRMEDLGCPSGGRYTINAYGQPATCDVGEHARSRIEPAPPP